jgi:hypothetical protein
MLHLKSGEPALQIQAVSCGAKRSQQQRHGLNKPIFVLRCETLLGMLGSHLVLDGQFCFDSSMVVMEKCASAYSTVRGFGKHKGRREHFAAQRLRSSGRANRG